MREDRRTRMTAMLTVIVQWLAVAACVFSNKHGVPIWMNFGAQLPGPTIPAAFLSQAHILVPIGVVSTLAVALIEFRAKSERTRFTTQVVVLAVWLLFTAFVLAAMFLPTLKTGAIATYPESFTTAESSSTSDEGPTRTQP